MHFYVNVLPLFLLMFLFLRMLKASGNLSWEDASLNVESIGDCFLQGCMSLETVDLGAFEKVTCINTSFLFRCESLKEISNISGLRNAKSIGDLFLYECTSLVWDRVTRLHAAVSDDFDRGRRRSDWKSHRLHGASPTTAVERHPPSISNKKRNKEAHITNGNGTPNNGQLTISNQQQQDYGYGRDVQQQYHHLHHHHHQHQHQQHQHHHQHHQQQYQANYQPPQYPHQSQQQSQHPHQVDNQSQYQQYHQYHHQPYQTQRQISDEALLRLEGPPDTNTKTKRKKEGSVGSDDEEPANPLLQQNEELKAHIRQQAGKIDEQSDRIDNLTSNIEDLLKQITLLTNQLAAQQKSAEERAKQQESRFQQQLESERAQVTELNKLREEIDRGEDDDMDTDPQETEKLRIEMQRELRKEYTEKRNMIKEDQSRELREIRNAHTQEQNHYWLKNKQRTFEETAKKEDRLVEETELIQQYWSFNVLSHQEFLTGMTGVLLTTTANVNKIRADYEQKAWETMSLVTLQRPATPAREEQVPIQQAGKIVLRKVWVTDLGSPALVKGTDNTQAQESRELVVRIEKRWTEEEEWRTFKKAPKKATESFKEMDGFIEVWHPIRSEETITMMMRVKAAHTADYLGLSGQNGIFIKERDHLSPVAIKAAVIWLPREYDLDEALNKTNGLTGSLGLVMNGQSLGLRVRFQSETTARLRLQLPAKLPEHRISGIPLGMTTEEAVKQLYLSTGWKVQKTREGIHAKTNSRWMIIRGEQKGTGTVSLGGKLCLVEDDWKTNGEETETPSTTKTSAPQQRTQQRQNNNKPERRKDPSETTNARWRTREDFIVFHGKKEGARLWRQAGQANQTSSTTEMKTPTSTPKESTPATTPPTETHREKDVQLSSGVESRMDRLEKMMEQLMTQMMQRN
eukprot:TRINITY_DN1744_c0_g1_i13.p1 TRINITY_DN1744_c0_g1~~TRINITY_DN1744_c0_g1_i13.p1  ORF type:complete len:913 (+),score=199.83 TRINITY_DN1744_c0_g1_i13:341-3079(+)